ncbi:MAG: hypothetical protein DMF84_19190 [Acidobacteria bacterium]|nr:MAG: hypothetical protein DMF84_19190 [Acidobacteriota bacterium]
MGRVANRIAAIVASVWCVWLITAFAQAPACGPNPVVCENQLTGDSDYEVDGGGAGDPSIQGFAADISVNTGQTVRFKIATDSAHYRIAIYRLGYYGGAGARKIVTLPDFTTPQIQPNCTQESPSGPPTGLVDCGNWTVSASWNSAGATSGIYLAKLTRLDVTPSTSSHIPFIVRDDARTADILFQTSDTTWQAYNQYGGGSLYCGGPISNAGTAYSCPGRAVRVSYNRPIDTRDHDPQSFLFNAEYPMVRWLEANGYDVKYWSGVDTDRLGADLSGLHKPKAFLSVGHDEYWSGNQRARVEQARNAGVNLAFFSGNEMFWKTRWEPSIDGTVAPFRTLVSYKETMRNDINNDPLDPLDTGPNPITTGTWRDTRFGAPGDGGRPENALTGQIWTVNCCSSQIEIPVSMRALRFWRNTRVADLTAGVVFLPNESLGYEWDEDLDNGVRPPGLVRMSLATRTVAERILDFGTKVGQGTATHSLTLYRHTSGALVFGAGTVQWSWGLDGAHDRGLAADTHTPDHAMQQATFNLLADMDAQPANPQVGADPNRPLVRGVKSTDALGPISTITSPAVGTSVRSGERVVINGTATDQGGGTVAGVEVSVDGGVTWKAAQGTAAWSFDWSPGATGLMTVRARAIDDSGNLESGGAAATVTIEPGTCPCTSLWHPATVPPIADFNDPTALELGVKFTSGPHVGNLWTSNGTKLATATFASESTTGWQQVLFPSPVPIAANTMYVASYHTTVGHYAATPGYFTSAGTDAPPLHALTSAVAGGNGVFLSIGASGFPTQSFNATNYWVDVVFSPTNNDTTPPLIFDVAERTIDSANVVITWTTNESSTSRIEYSTAFDFPAAGTTTASDPAFVTAHRMALGHLTPNTTYFYRVSSADRAGNTATELAPSFTVPGPTLRDTAQADFAAGQPTFTYAAETDDGELMLSPAEGAEFSGTSLPDGWRALPWSGGGFARVDNGLLDVDGWRVGTCSVDSTGACTEAGTYGPGRSLEFVATFSSDGFEHAGFGVTLGSLAEPWAIFSTFTGGGLVARTNTGAVSVDEPLGSSYIGAPHRYRIDWHTDGTVNYFIDGVQVAAHTAVVNGPMRPVAASDFSVGGGTVKVDWMRMTPYAAAGSLLSRVFDASAIVDWHSIQWAADQPAGTSVAISLRTGNTATPDGTWSNFAAVPAPGTLTQRSRFIQYRAELASTDPGSTPRLDDIIISTSHAPVAQNDRATVPVNGSFVFPASGPGSLTANDTDADINDVLRVIAVTQPGHGVAVLNADGSVVYAPTLNYQGSDTFTYTVSDGLLTGTATVTMFMGVSNQPPVAQPDAFSLLEDSGSTTLTVLANDSDPEDGTNVKVTAVTQGAHGTVAITPGAASVSYTPQADFFGSDTFTYTISDTAGATATANVTLTVKPVDDAPRFVKGADQTVLEDAGAKTVTGWATSISAGPANENGQALNFIVTNNNNALFDLQPAVASNGTLTYTTKPTANGSATVTVSLHDDGGTLDGGVDTSAPQTFTISVTAVNDAPSFVKGADQTVLEDSGPTSVVAWATAISAGPADEAGQTLTFTVTNNNAALFAAAPAVSGTGVLTFTPAANASGSSIVTVKLADSGGTVNGGVDSSTQTFVITVKPVNDAPSFVKGADQTVLEDAGAQTVPGWATAMSAGPASEAGQTLTFGVTASNTALFAVQPAITPTGTLSYTPALNANGSTTVTVVLRDNGGTLDGGVDASASQTFTINLTAVNDVPSFVKGLDQTVLEDAGPRVVTAWATSISAGGPDESAQVLTFEVTNSNNALFSAQPQIAANGTLSYTPAATANGSATVTVALRDNGGTLNGGSDLSASQTFTITVTPVNDVPSFTKGANQVVLEDAVPQSIAWATAISAGPANESAQTLNFIVSNSSNVLFSAQPQISATGTLTFTAAPNVNGLATVTVQLHDNGGIADGGVDTSAAQTFTISVTAVNDAPSFTKGADQTSSAGAGAQTVAVWATNLSAGPADESAQALNFIVTTNNAALFSVQPVIAANGTLTYTPAATGGGTAVVTVQLHDNGGVANGGVDTSAAQTFNITLPFPTTTTLSSPTVSPTTYGQAVVLNASVTSAGGTPQGSIDFLDSGVLLGNVTLTNGSASLSTTAIGAGTARTITAVYKPTPSFVTSQAAITRVVTAAATTSTFIVTPTVSQYSDVVTFDTTLTPGTLGNTWPAQSASFRIGTQVVATAAFVWDATAGVLRARYIGPLIEGPTQTGQLKPGTRTIAILYNGVSSNYTVANRTGSMSITREDATVSYIGDTQVVCSTNCAAVPVLLKARVTEAQDGSLGDIRNATVAFVNRTTGLTIATVPVSADGTASTTWTVNVAASQTTKIGMVVGNYYIRSNTLDDGTVVITKQ